MTTASGDADPALEVPRRSIPLLRAALVVAILVATRLVAGAPPTGPAFDAIAAVATVYAVAGLLAAGRPQPKIAWWIPASLDLGLAGALVYESGGAGSDLRWVLALAPLLAALVLGPWPTGAFGAAALAAYAVVAIAGGDPPRHVTTGFAFAHCLYIAWSGAAAVALSTSLRRRAARVTALAASRGRLVAQALDAEDRERRRLGEALHDDALQNLLAARQDLEEGTDEGHLARARAALEETVKQLREAAFVLQSPVLQHLDVAHALDALAAQQARRGRFRARVDVAPDAMGIDDQLIVSLSRELLVNAARHSGASEVSLVLRRDESALRLEVRDDGRGFDDERRLAALREGHIGLASGAERVEALGGRLVVNSAPGSGAEILVSVPVARERRRAPRPVRRSL